MIMPRPAVMTDVCPSCGSDRAELAEKLREPLVFEEMPGGYVQQGGTWLRSEAHQKAVLQIAKCDLCREHFAEVN